MSNRLADAFIAIRDHNWIFISSGSRKFLVPPEDDIRRSWCAQWDENGIPHYLPKYSSEESFKPDK